MPTSPRSIAQLADLALDIQGASNLRAVAREFVKVCDELADQKEDPRNHPAAIVLGDKIAHLLGTQNIGQSRVMDAYNECYRLSGRR